MVLISGASSGIGKEAARAFAAAGSSVILVSRSKENLELAVQDIRKAGGDAHAYPADISDPKAVQQLAEIINKEHGTPDVLINNAGSGQWKFMHETSFEEVEQYMAVPYFGAFYLTKVFLPEMLTRDSGIIVNMTSYAGIIPFSGATAYIAARKAMIGFFEALRADLHGTGVKSSLAYFAKVESSYWDNNPGSEERMPGAAVLIPSISPAKAARALVRGVSKKRTKIFTPGLLRIFNLLHRWTSWFTNWLMFTMDHPIKKTIKP